MPLWGKTGEVERITVVDPPFGLVGGASVESFGEQPLARRGMSLKLVSSYTSQFSDEKLLLVRLVKPIACDSRRPILLITQPNVFCLAK